MYIICVEECFYVLTVFIEILLSASSNVYIILKGANDRVFPFNERIDIFPFPWRLSCKRRALSFLIADLQTPYSSNVFACNQTEGWRFGWFWERFVLQLKRKCITVNYTIYLLSIACRTIFTNFFTPRYHTVLFLLLIRLHLSFTKNTVYLMIVVNLLVYFFNSGKYLRLILDQSFKAIKISSSHSFPLINNFNLKTIDFLA